ncbi:hypothetical protein [Actinoplanes friuliensis]|nr:hypothetical protein [Actinoplanes friuliensis]
MDLHQTPAAMPTTDEAMLPGVTVVVETFLLGTTGGRLTYRTASRALTDDEHPDAVARALAGVAADGLLHSTSWRFASGRIVLTYAALPDPDPGSATVVRAPGQTLAAGDGPLSPSPGRVDADDVAVHACRHLAFLRRTDPVVKASAARHRVLWDLLDEHQPAVAGLLRPA